jgi:biopolymer transport protein ExbD
MQQHDVKETNVMAEINVTPMVDVMLVLLIIFMVVTPALLGGFNAKLPQGVNLKDREDDPDRTTLGIDRDGNYYLNKKPIAKNDAPRLLEAEFARHPQDRVVFVRADRTLRWVQLAEAMRIARNSGARVSALVTEQDPNAPRRPDEEAAAPAAAPRR